MIALVIGKQQVATLHHLRTHAEQYPILLAQVIARTKKRRSAHDEPGYECDLPMGFHVRFTIEQHPAGWCRHLSVCLNQARPGSIPSVQAIQKIGRLLGMRIELTNKEMLIYYEGQPASAMSIIEPIAGESQPQQRKAAIDEQDHV